MRGWVAGAWELEDKAEQRYVKPHLQKTTVSCLRFRNGTEREASIGREDAEQSKDDKGKGLFVREAEI